MKKNQLKASTKGRLKGKLHLVLYVTLLFIALFPAKSFASKYSQKTFLNINLKNATIEQVFEEIRSNTEFKILYKNDELNLGKRMDVRFKKAQVEKIISEILKDQDIDYKIVDKQIILSKRIKKSPKTAVFQQKKSVSGQVKDTMGEPLPGVTVVIKGKTIGTITDKDGKFQLELPANAEVLLVSFVGMKQQEINVSGRKNITVTMYEESIGLEEVVAVGYGVVKKSDLTGAVTSVKSDKLEKVANTSVAHMLAGRAPGLTVSQNSAQPGGGMNLQIRGAASGRSPLIIIDGFPITGFSEPKTGNRYNGGSKESTLNSINPNDIESIEVLKDASATSIYGARAAGGVIIITTKRGKEGDVKVTYRGSYSVQSLYGLPEMLTPQNFMDQTNEVKRELWMYDWSVAPYGDRTWDQAVADAEAANKPVYAPSFSDEEIKNFKDGTDWLDEIVRTGAIQQHDISITGGTKKTKYLFSAGLFQQDGVVKKNDFKRFTGRLNLDQEFNEWLSGGVTSSISQIKNTNIPLGGGAFESSSIIRAAMQFNPLIPIKDENGNYMLDPNQAYLPNPVSMLEIEDKSRTERFLATTFLKAEPLKGLSLKLTLGVDRNQSQLNQYLPTTTLYGKNEGGHASKSVNEKTDYLTNFVINYSKTIAQNHKVDIMGAYEYQKFTWNGLNASNSKFPYDGVKWNNLEMGEREKPGVGSYGGTSKMASYISRVNYSFKGKYLLAANLRYDGSSNFAENNKWGLFPGVSMAWRINEEEFMKPFDNWLSNLKFRVGYGQTGNDNVGYGITSYYTAGWNYAFNSKPSNGIGLAALGNPNLKWETQTDLNVGLDIGLYRGRISASLEYFDRVVSDLLGQKNLMSYHEVNKITYNLDAKKQSRGWEFALNTVNIDKTLKWTTDFNVTYYRDRWLKRDPSWKPDIHDLEKEEWGRMLYWESDGLVKSGEEIPHMPGAIPGTVKIKDVDGYLMDEEGQRILDENGKPKYLGKPDGKLDNADKVCMGNNTPISFGVNNTIRYKNFDLTFYFYGMLNRWRINKTKSFYVNEAFRIKDGANMMVDILDRWSYKNQDSSLPSILQVNSSYGTGDYYLEKAHFIRLKNLTLGYTLPQEVTNRVFSSARLFADAQNLFVLTPYSGTDPETDSMAAYPNQRTFTFGVELSF